MIALVLVAALALLVVVLILLCPFAARMDRKPTVGTTNDPAVAWMVTRQRAYGKWLRKKGRTLLADCEYEPVLHQRENVIPLRGRR